MNAFLKVGIALTLLAIALLADQAITREAAATVINYQSPVNLTGYGNVSGNGTNERLAYWTSATSIAASKIFYDGNLVGIFDNTPDAMVDINIEDPAVEGLIVQGVIGQTADLFDVRDNIPNIFLKVNATGGIVTAADIRIGYKDTDGDGVADAPATLLLDAPPSSVTSGQSSELAFESSTTSPSNTLDFDSAGKAQSVNVVFRALGLGKGTCIGGIFCPGLCQFAPRCGTGCSATTSGCISGRRRCAPITTCGEQTNKDDCEFYGCSWTFGASENNDVLQYTDDGTDASLMTDDDTDVLAYANPGDGTRRDQGSFHLNLSKAGTPTGYFTIEDDGTLDAYYLHLHDPTYYFSETGVLQASTLQTSGGQFSASDTQMSMGSGILVDTTTTYLDYLAGNNNANIEVQSPVTISTSGTMPLVLTDNSATGYPGFDVYYTSLPAYTGYSFFYDTNLATVTLRSKYTHVDGYPWGDFYFEVSPTTQGVFEKAMIISSTKNVNVTANFTVQGDHIQLSESGVPAARLYSFANGMVKPTYSNGALGGAYLGSLLVGTGYDAAWDSAGLHFASNKPILWSSSTNANYGGPFDIGLERAGTGLLKVTNGSTSYGNVSMGWLGVNMIPSYPLDVTGAARISQELYVYGTYGVLSKGYSAMAAGKNIIFQDFTSATPLVVINDTTGYVGIGTTTPADALHVYKPAGQTYGIFQSGASDWLAFFASNSLDPAIYWNSGNDLRLGTASNNLGGGWGEKMRITSDGKVGIGSTAPGAMLQINTSAAATKGLIVKGAASQSANLTEWQNSTGGKVLAVGATGTKVYLPKIPGNGAFICYNNTDGSIYRLATATCT